MATLTFIPKGRPAIGINKNSALASVDFSRIVATLGVTNMKKRIIYALAALLLVSFFSFVIRPQHAMAYDPNDPYDTGCASNAYAANSYQFKVNNVVIATLKNMYSTTCITNWAEIEWSSGKAVQVNLFAQNQSTGDLQCFPQQCNSTIFYTGGLSPAWTDMVDGHDLVCVSANIIYQGKTYSNQNNVCA